jgi:hypothetical protein
MAKNGWWVVGLGMVVLLLFFSPTCTLKDRGLAKLEIEDELKLGISLDEVKSHWYQYSTKPLVFDAALSDTKHIVYRGNNRDMSVNSFYVRFNLKRSLREAEWRYQASMAQVKEKQLLDYWTKRLWRPVRRRGIDGTTYLWVDRKAELILYVTTGICHLTHRLR